MRVESCKMPRPSRTSSVPLERVGTRIRPGGRESSALWFNGPQRRSATKRGTAPVANLFARRLRRRGQESQSCWRRQRATYPGGDIQMAITDRLAIDGGTPVRTTPLLPGWPGGLLIGEEEKAAVLEVIESQSLFRHYGPRPLHRATSLEKAFAQAMGARHALAVTSGTAALITALAALGIGPGDEVAVPTYTWIATINAVGILGAVRFHDQGSVRMEELDLLIAGDSPLIIGINFRMGELTAAVGLAQLKKMDWIIERMRANARRIRDGIRDLPGLTFRTLYDEDGETGATVIFFVPTAAQADRFARALAAENLPASVPWWSGQHVYNHFDPIINRRLLSTRKCSWECPHYKGSATLVKGQFPRTDAILQRAVHLDVHPLFADQDISDVIAGIHKVAQAVL